MRAQEFSTVMALFLPRAKNKALPELYATRPHCYNPEYLSGVEATIIPETQERRPGFQYPLN
jgi:hypothetical protein